MNDIPEDLMNRLREAGFNPEDPQWVQRKNVDLTQLPTLERQRQILQTLQTLLTHQLASDMTQLEEARENLARLKRGGGR